MKNQRLNVWIVIIVTVFFSSIFSVKNAEAQNKDSAKPVSTAKKPTASAQKAKSTSDITSKTQGNAQIIISATSVRIRREPDFAAETIQAARIGEVFSLLEENENWCKVRFGKNDDEASGWISKKLTQRFSKERRGEIYSRVADKYLKQSSLNFGDAAQIFDFLTAAQKDVKDAGDLADLGYKRVLALKAALKGIGFGKQSENPYKDFLEKNKEEVVYNEPAGEWLVRSDLFWELRGKYKNFPIAEEIAWAAAQNPIPGECEGYVNCYLYLLRSTDGEYLNFYPNGKYSREALKNVTNYLEPIVADTRAKSVYYSASDISDRADFNKYLTELRAIVSKTPHIEKSKTLQQIKQIGEAYR
ncbi:MAG TPA: SH3 domain-containing protein [Pyrinomonadaceae bacterium]|jgi:hypothetical protein